jgi:2-amino-4-hydroxy-6-hydroxymethyldihydropteridine diphosphokinase
VAQALIGLGSNIEPRRDYLRLAVEELGKAPLGLLKLSSLYETEPMDVKEQAPFLNMAALVDSPLRALPLLKHLQGIEALAHKKVEIRRGPRTLDLDLWACGNELSFSEELTLPHPRLPERPFALLPLEEIAPKWRHPRLGLNAREMLERLPKPWPRVELLGPL